MFVSNAPFEFKIFSLNYKPFIYQGELKWAFLKLVLYF